MPSSPAVTAVMKGNRRSDTKPEVALRSQLHRMGLRFRKDYPIRTDGLRTRVDIAFRAKRVAVMVDGCFWHVCPRHGTRPKSNEAYWGPKLQRNVERDARVNAALTEAGWTVVRVWEHEDPTQAAYRIQLAVQAVRR